MIILLCRACHQAIRVMGELDEVEGLIGKNSDFWPDQYRCPSCNVRMEACYEKNLAPSTLAAFQVRDLTPKEAFISLSGMGFPDERLCRREQIDAVFATPIRRVVGEETSTSRFVIDHIEFWDGTRVYFGSAPAGALIYRIAPSMSYTAKELIKNGDH